MNHIINRIRQELNQSIDEKTKISGQKYFKERIIFYGVKTTTVGSIGKKYFKDIRNKDKTEIFDLCEQLWKSGYLEESFIACNWSYYILDDYKPSDFEVFEKWVEYYVNNWASCDTLCNHTIGAFIERYPDYLANLKLWVKSTNRWMRRGAAVSLIIPAKQGMFLNDIFDIADALLLDQDDLVQKGYGWMLKAASRIHEQEVFEYVIQNKKSISRTALRYAIEKMRKELKEKAMEK